MDWMKAIGQMKTKQTVYYLKEDTEQKTRFFVRGVVYEFFDTSREFVVFYAPKDQNGTEYMLDRKTFEERFVAVVEES